MAAPVLFSMRFETREKEVKASRGVGGGREPRWGVTCMLRPLQARRTLIGQSCQKGPSVWMITAAPAPSHPDVKPRPPPRGSLCSGENHDPPPAFSPSSSSSSSASVLSSLLPLVVAFSFDNKVELVVRAALFFNLHFPSPGRLWESNPLPHPHCESILIEQRRRLNCLRLACDTNYPHVLSKIILIRKTIKSLVLAPASYSIASVL